VAGEEKRWAKAEHVLGEPFGDRAHRRDVAERRKREPRREEHAADALRRERVEREVDDRETKNEGHVLGPWCLVLSPSYVHGPRSIRTKDTGPRTDQEPRTDQAPSTKHQGPSNCRGERVSRGTPWTPLRL